MSGLASLTKDQLHALIYLVEEHCAQGRGPMTLKPVRADLAPCKAKHRMVPSYSYPSELKRAAAYNILLDFYDEPFGLEEARQRMKEALHVP